MESAETARKKEVVVENLQTPALQFSYVKELERN
jgi:hypothetical protein